MCLTTPYNAHPNNSSAMTTQCCISMCILCVACVWCVCGVWLCVVYAVCVYLCVNNNDIPIPIVYIILSIGLYKKNNDIPIFEPAAAGSV